MLDPSGGYVTACLSREAALKTKLILIISLLLISLAVDAPNKLCYGRGAT